MILSWKILQHESCIKPINSNYLIVKFRFAEPTFLCVGVNVNNNITIVLICQHFFQNFFKFFFKVFLKQFNSLLKVHFYCFFVDSENIITLNFSFVNTFFKIFSKIFQLLQKSAFFYILEVVVFIIFVIVVLKVLFIVLILVQII